MRNLVVARRYAKALYELAAKENNMDDVLQSLSNICDALKSAPEAAQVLFNPLITAEQKERILKAVTSNKLMLKFALLLAKRKRLPMIFDIRTEVQAMADQAAGVHRVLVKTATPLSEPERREIEKSLAHSVGGKIIGQFQVAAELIGGVWVKVGDKVLDASLQGRFEDLRQHLAHSAN